MLDRFSSRRLACRPAAGRTRRRVSRFCLLIGGMLGAAGSAAAQSRAVPDAPRVEVWAGISGAIAGRGGMLTSAYSPPLLLDGDFTSHAGQTIAGDRTFGVGAAAGVNVLPSAHVGFQVLLDRATCDVEGTNTPYAFSLEYVSRQPPDDRPQVVILDRSTAWPDTSGSLTQLAIAFNVLVRIGRPDRFSAIVSAGPSYHRVSGSLEPVGFTAFHLGGHSVLFEDDYRLLAALEPAHGIGFDAGVELDAPVGSHTAIVVGVRYFAGPDVEAQVTPSAVSNPGDITFSQSITDIAARLRLAPMRISISSSRVLVGLKVVR